MKRLIIKLFLSLCLWAGIAGLCTGCCSLLFQNDGYPERSFAEHRVSDFAG